MSDSDGITNKGRLYLTGLEEGSRLERSVNGDAWTRVDSPEGLPFPGTQTIRFRQIDLAGNVSEELSLTATLDTFVDFPAVYLLNDNGSSSTDRITSDGRIRVTNLEPNAVWEYSLNGSTWVQGEGNELLVRQPGQHTVLFRQIDLAGNTRTPLADNNMGNGVIIFQLLSGSESINNSLRTPEVRLADDTYPAVWGLIIDRITSNGTLIVESVDQGNRWLYSVNGSEWIVGSGDRLTVTGDGFKSVDVKQQVFVAGIGGEFSNTRTYTFELDTVAKAPKVSLYSDTGLSSTDGITSDERIVVSGLEQWALPWCGYECNPC
jgi:hypothetical protein